MNMAHTSTEVLRVRPEDVKAHLEAGQPMTILDVRSPAAWDSSNLKIPGAIRVEADHFRPDPHWPRDQTTVVYCT
jgi:rhodanese-related sulfurtransferase